MLIWQSLSRKFYRNSRGVSIKVSEKTNFDTIKIRSFARVYSVEPICNWRDEAIGSENSKESSDKRATNQVAKNFRWFSNCAHCMNNTKHGGNDPKSRDTIGKLLDCS